MGREQRGDELPADYRHRDVARRVGIEMDMPVIFQRAEYVEAARGNPEGEHRHPRFHERAPDARVAGGFRVVEAIGNDGVAAGAQGHRKVFADGDKAYRIAGENRQQGAVVPDTAVVVKRVVGRLCIGQREVISDDRSAVQAHQPDRSGRRQHRRDFA